MNGCKCYWVHTAEMKVFLWSADFIFLNKIFGNKMFQTWSFQLANEGISALYRGCPLFRQITLSFLIPLRYQMGNQKQQSEEHGQCNDQKKKRTNIYLQHTTHTTKDGAIQNSLKADINSCASGRVRSSCSTSNTRQFCIVDWHESISI